MSEPLDAAIRHVSRGFAATVEGDIFSILRRSSIVLRSAEFATVDGGIDCTHRFAPGSSYAMRYWQYSDRSLHPETSSDVIPLDVKGSVAGCAGDQVYITTLAQKRRVAVYITKDAADDRFVNVIPNYFQDATALRGNVEIQEWERQEYSVNITRVSFFPPRAYGSLDQCGSPYRMPLALLHDAVEGIRRHVRKLEPYKNPYNGVEFADWEPLTTRVSKWFQPLDTSGVFTAHEAVTKMFQDITFGEHEHPIEMDFVGLQPYSGDLRIIQRLHKVSKQYIVQHKIDGRRRALGSRLEKVFVTRGQGNGRRYYFSAYDRFDFLFYQFAFNRPGQSPALEFFFLPERVIPDSFYTAEETEADFERGDFRDYRFTMDEGGEWVDSIWKVIQQCPQPRREGTRPSRAGKQDVDTQEGARSVPRPLQIRSVRGSAEYKAVVRNKHYTFFYEIMRRCAVRQSGLLFLLATKDAYGEFGYTRFTWTDEEVDSFHRDRRPPRVGHQLPGDAPTVPISYYARYTESWFYGPNVSPAQFRRLNSILAKRLVLWDIGGFDTMQTQIAPAVIPSDDISPTEPQRQLFQSNLGVKRSKRMPNISSLLQTGIFASEYAVGNNGPLLYEGVDWDQVYSLIDSFAGEASFEHPRKMTRNPADYRHPLRHIQQRAVREHIRLAAGPAAVGGLEESSDED